MVKNFNILIIEDEIILAKQIEKVVVGNCKYTTNIEIVNSGEKGLEKICEKMPDFIFLNQCMPGMTGIKMLEKCKELKLKLPTVLVITGGITTRESNRFLQLGVKHIFSRFLSEGEREYMKDIIEEAYETSTNISDEDMMRLIDKQTKPILDNIDKSRTPYQVSLIGFILKYLIENKQEYSKENKNNIYEFFKKRDNLEDRILKEIQETIEGVIGENYAQGNPIRKINYGINKDEIQEEFFHKLKDNVIKDIIAESN